MTEPTEPIIDGVYEVTKALYKRQGYVDPPEKGQVKMVLWAILLLANQATLLNKTVNSFNNKRVKKQKLNKKK